MYKKSSSARKLAKNGNEQEEGAIEQDHIHEDLKELNRAGEFPER